MTTQQCQTWCKQQEAWKQKRAAWEQRYGKARRTQPAPVSARFVPRAAAAPAAPPPPPRAGWCRKPDGTPYPCTLRGADFGAAEDSKILMFGVLPMVAAVGAGLWMGLRG